MADQRTSPIQSENLPTVAAVAFILALLAMIFGMWGFADVRRVGAALKLSHDNSLETQKATAANQAKIAELEGRLAAVEARLAANATPAQAPQ
jgi:uncharacterized protein HemX